MEAGGRRQRLPFRWASGISESRDLDVAVQEATEIVREDLAGVAPDLVMVFASTQLTDRYDDIPAKVYRELSPKAMVGTTGAGVIGSGEEVEGRPALAVMGGTLPGVELVPFHIEVQQLRRMDISPKKWAEHLGVPLGEAVHFLLFVHPFTMPVDELVTALDQAFPNGRKVGGLSSGGGSPDTMAVFLNDRSYFEGATGVAIWGEAELDIIVAQGCRPVGPAMKVTRAAGPDIFRLDGEPALTRVLEVIKSLPLEDQQLSRHSLFVGVAMEAHEKEGEKTYDGGYLVRNILGADPGSQVLRVGHSFHEGQTIRLQLREAQTARDELISLLSEYKLSVPPFSEAAAMLFSCTGRGIHLYGHEGHDSKLLLEALGPIPLAGFFCNGEIGPVGEVTYVHGYTSSVGVLKPKRRPA